jgi:ATP-dependent RNA helicase DDX42
LKATEQDPDSDPYQNVTDPRHQLSYLLQVLPLGGAKWQWLVKHLVQFMSQGSVLVFVTRKQNCEELANNLKIKAEIDCRSVLV